MKIDLYIGGHAQGKEELVRNKYGSSALIINELHIWIRERLEEMYKGNADMTVLTDDISNMLWKTIEGNDKVVIISDEIGNGIVPIDGFDRCWREVTGRVLTRLAGKADNFYRVICGMEQKIK